MGTAFDPLEVEGVPGTEWCQAWTARVDERVEAFHAGLGGRRGLAVVALGSYARRELCPASDIDLLLLHDGWRRDELEELVRALCYPLWDAGLSVGHAVRSPKEAVKAAGERIDTATALTERRLVAGDPGLLDDLASRMGRWLRKGTGRFLGEIAEADRARHQRAGRHAGMLEPELKDGAGGLRDLHSLRWAAAALLNQAGLDPLVGARYLGAADHGELTAASHTLLGARAALHLVALRAGRRPGGDADRLRLDLQDEVATLLGDEHADALLRRVGLALRTVAHVHGRTWPLLLADGTAGRRRSRPAAETVAEGIALRDGLVEASTSAALGDEPALPLRLTAAAARRQAHLGRTTAARLRTEVAAAGSLPWDAAGRAALLNTLRCGPDALPALADADHLGILAAYLPEWPRIRGRPQRNPFHRFDLDTHGFEAVAELHEVGRGVLDEQHARLWSGLGDHDSLLLATLLHDIGKAWPGDHSIVGARAATRWVTHMGFDNACAERVALLVREHLLLPDVATRRDLDDEQEIAAVAARVGEVGMLDALYLLSLADARATGPAAHSPWKDALLQELHARVRRYLLEGPGAPPAAGDAVREARALAAAEGIAPGELDALLEGVPERYLNAADAQQIVEHARLLRPVPGIGELRARVRPGPTDETLVLTVVAADHRGLFADCAGVLAGHGADVLDVRAFTRDDGVALDWFVLRPGHGPGAGPGTGPGQGTDWEEVLDDLRRAAGGLLDVDALVRRREHRRDERPSRHHALVPVEVRYEASGDAWSIEVRGPDAPGVLYRLSRVLREAELDIVGVRAATLPPEVRDVFSVRLLDQPPDTHELTARLTAAAGFPEELVAR